MNNYTPMATEIDSHADTHCFGANFRPILFTQQECTVAPFLAEYEEQANVRICTGATAFTRDNGEVIILIFGQGLWFGEKMSRSLINPYQCRAHGIGICDDPMDPNGRELGFELENGELIPLAMVGTTCGVVTRCPTQEEMDSCRQVLMSDEDQWDPTRRIFTMSNIKDVRGDITERTIQQVVNTLGQPRANILDDVVVHDYDRINIEMSVGLTQSIMPNRLERRKTNATITNERHHGVKSELLAQKWGIGLEKARQTLKATTQHAVRSAVLPLKRRYRTDLLSQRLRRLNCRFYTDTLFSKQVSANGNTCAQLFTDGKGAVIIYPMRSKAQAGQMLTAFTQDVGIPNELVMDGASEQTGPNTEMVKEIRRKQIKVHITEPYSPWQNKAENAIGIIKSKHNNRMIKRSVPKVFWDFGLVWESEIYSRTTGKDGIVPLERLTGDTIDISDWIDFEFWDSCWYWDPAGGDNKRKIGRWLGVSHNVGSALCYYVVTSQGNVISRTSVQHFTTNDIAIPEIQQALRDYHTELQTHISDGAMEEQETIFYPDDLQLNSNSIDKEEGLEIDDFIDNSTPETAADSFDQYIGVEVCMGPDDGRGGKLMGKVIKRLKDGDGDSVGKSHYNPLHDTSVYEVQYPDVTFKKRLESFFRIFCAQSSKTARYTTPFLGDFGILRGY